MAYTPIKGHEFSRALRAGPGKLAGGYCASLYLYMRDGEIMCWDCAKANEARIRCAAMNGNAYRDGWAPLGFDVYYEGPIETCAECGKECPSAYGDPKSRAEQLAESWTNGNRTDVLREVIESGPVLALDVCELLPNDQQIVFMQMLINRISED